MTSRVKNSAGRRRKALGFTLLELLVVLIILGFSAAVAVPSVSRFMNSLEFKKETARIMAVMRYARLMAVTKGQPVYMEIAEDPNSLKFTGAITENKNLGLNSDDTLSMDPATIIFSPAGHATPGSLNLTKGNRSQKIIIDPLSGLPVLDYESEK